DAGWTFDVPQSVTDKRQVTLATGAQARVPIRFELPKGLAPGSYLIHLAAKFGTGETHEDHFLVDVLSPVAPTAATLPLTRPSGTLSPIGGEGWGEGDSRRPGVARIALFDPKGETARLLETAGVRARKIPANADLSMYDILVVGK